MGARPGLQSAESLADHVGLSPVFRRGIGPKREVMPVSPNGTSGIAHQGRQSAFFPYKSG